MKPLNAFYNALEKLEKKYCNGIPSNPAKCGYNIKTCPVKRTLEHPKWGYGDRQWCPECGGYFMGDRVVEKVAQSKTSKVVDGDVSQVSVKVYAGGHIRWLVKSQDYWTRKQFLCSCQAGIELGTEVYASHGKHVAKFPLEGEPKCKHGRERVLAEIEKQVKAKELVNV